MKKIYIRFLIVCWALAIFGTIFTLISIPFQDYPPHAGEVIFFGIFLSAFLLVIDFITLGIINPTKLLKMI